MKFLTRIVFLFVLMFSGQFAHAQVLCPFGADVSDEDLCGSANAYLPNESELNIQNTDNMVPESFNWYFGGNGPDVGGAPTNGENLTAASVCEPSTYIFEAYVQCDVNGILSWIFVALHSTTVYPSLEYSILMDEENCVLTVDTDCVGFYLIEIDGVAAPTYVPSPGSFHESIEVVVWGFVNSHRTLLSVPMIV